MLSVLADGTVQAPEVRHAYGTATISLSKDELGELLRFVVREQKFMELNRAGIQERVREAAGEDGSPAPLDGRSTVVSVHLAERANAVKWYALVETARRSPGAEGLGRLARVAERLERLRVLTIVGGKTALASYLDLANAALKKAFLTANGGRRIVFRRTDPGQPPIYASIQDPGEGDPIVTAE